VCIRGPRTSKPSGRSSPLSLASRHAAFDLPPLSSRQVRPNPFGALPYPYVPQGLLSIQQMD
jgi:hypothetical protein